MHWKAEYVHWKAEWLSTLTIAREKLWTCHRPHARRSMWGTCYVGSTRTYHRGLGVDEHRLGTRSQRAPPEGPTRGGLDGRLLR